MTRVRAAAERNTSTAAEKINKMKNKRRISSRN